MTEPFSAQVAALPDDVKATLLAADAARVRRGSFGPATCTRAAADHLTAAGLAVVTTDPFSTDWVGFLTAAGRKAAAMLRHPSRP